MNYALRRKFEVEICLSCTDKSASMPMSSCHESKGFHITELETGLMSWKLINVQMTIRSLFVFCYMIFAIHFSHL